MSCKKCGLCCRWMCIDIARIDFDVRWVNVRGGFIKDGFTFVPFVCTHLTKDNLCGIEDYKPSWCRSFPVKDEPWLRALGCGYFEER
jgi:Fe-S-cluster containining protein